MKAIVIKQPGGPEVLQLQERPIPTVNDNEVLIKVKAAGLNRSDIFQRKGNYPVPLGIVPDILGLEVAGIVEKVGGNVSRWKTGDSVCALLSGGGYAEYCAVDARHCLPVPKGWSFEEAASLPEAVFTVWHNVFQRGKLTANENFLVHGGAGGIGITAIQLAKAFQANVYATCSSIEKCRFCMDLGATQCVNYHEEDFEKVFSSVGIDVILDVVGGDYTPKNLRLLKPDGRLVFINAIKGGSMEANIFTIMQKRLTITGSTLRMRDAAFKEALAAEIEKNVWPLMNARQFKPIIYQKFSLEEAAKAHEVMESGTHIGKIVLRV